MSLCCGRLRRPQRALESPSVRPSGRSTNDRGQAGYDHLPWVLRGPHRFALGSGRAARLRQRASNEASDQPSGFLRALARRRKNADLGARAGSAHLSENLLDRWSGRLDLNHRPPDHKSAFINNLRASLTENNQLARLLVGPNLDPEGECVANLGRPWTLLGSWFPRRRFTCFRAPALRLCAGVVTCRFRLLQSFWHG